MPPAGRARTRVCVCTCVCVRVCVCARVCTNKPHAQLQVGKGTSTPQSLSQWSSICTTAKAFTPDSHHRPSPPLIQATTDQDHH